MVVIKFPFTSMQQFNLDWIMEQLHKILQFMPLNGVAGDVLQRTVDGAAWQPISAVSLDIHGLNSTTPDGADELPIYDNDLAGNYKVTVQDILDMVPAAPVSSVNGQTGTVVLSIPSDTSDLTNGAGFVDAAGAAAAAPVQSVNGQTGAVIVSGGAVDSVNGKTGTVVLDKTDIGLGNVANVAQYSASNPPPYPVTSVNGQTGAVTVTGTALAFSPKQTFTVSKYMGIAVIDSDNVWYRMSTDEHFIMIGGCIDVTYNTTGDITVFMLSGPVLTGYTTTLTYEYGCLCFDSSGNMDMSMMTTMTTASVFRQANEIKLSVGAPSSTGTRKIIIPPCIFPIRINAS